jgi:RND family efflux transporter MFP subunit
LVLKQLLIAIVVVVAAAAAFVFLVPGAPQMLARVGIVLPSAEAAAPAGAPTAGGGGERPATGQPGQGGQPASGRPGGGRGGGREMVVVTAAASEGKINDKLTAIGEGAATQSVTVVAPASGTLVALAVQPGETIAAGAVIGQLDDAAERIAFERAEVSQRDADSALARTEELAKANSATTVQLNAAQLAATNARLETQSAKLALDRRTITSPIGGTVGLFQVSPGNQLGAQTVVTTIEDTSEIVISFYVPERYASVITVGMPVETTAVALPGLAMSGVVSGVDNRIDPASRTLKVQARVENAAGTLRPGMSFAVAMSFPGETFPSVDPLAIQWSSAGAYLWRFVDGKVERVAVEIIQRNSDGVLVKGELAKGDQIVVQGVQQLSDGAAVRLLDAPVAEGGERPKGQPGSAS